MKGLSGLALLSAVLATGLMGCPANAQRMTGAVVLENMGPRSYPSGYNETGRYARFIQDVRMSDLNLTNRDFEDWKPLDVSARKMTRHFLKGKANTTKSIVGDQEIARYIPQLEDYRLMSTNMNFDDRMFYDYRQSSPYMAQADSAMAKSYLRGLPVGTNLGTTLPHGFSLPISGAPRVLYFWQ